MNLQTVNTCFTVLGVYVCVAADYIYTDSPSATVCFEKYLVLKRDGAKIWRSILLPTCEKFVFEL